MAGESGGRGRRPFNAQRASQPGGAGGARQQRPARRGDYERGSAPEQPRGATRRPGGEPGPSAPRSFGGGAARGPLGGRGAGGANGAQGGRRFSSPSGATRFDSTGEGRARPQGARPGQPSSGGTGTFRSRLGEASSRGPGLRGGTAAPRRSSLSPFADGGDGSGDRRVGGRQVGGRPGGGYQRNPGFGGGRSGPARGGVPRSAPRRREERPQGYADLDEEQGTAHDHDAIFGAGPIHEPKPQTEEQRPHPAPRRTVRRRAE